MNLKYVSVVDLMIFNFKHILVYYLIIICLKSENSDAQYETYVVTHNISSASFYDGTYKTTWINDSRYFNPPGIRSYPCLTCSNPAAVTIRLPSNSTPYYDVKVNANSLFSLFIDTALPDSAFAFRGPWKFYADYFPLTPGRKIYVYVEQGDCGSCGGDPLIFSWTTACLIDTVTASWTDEKTLITGSYTLAFTIRPDCDYNKMMVYSSGGDRIGVKTIEIAWWINDSPFIPVTYIESLGDTLLNEGNTFFDKDQNNHIYLPFLGIPQINSDENLNNETDNSIISAMISEEMDLTFRYCQLQTDLENCLNDGAHYNNIQRLLNGSYTNDEILNYQLKKCLFSESSKQNNCTGILKIDND